MGVVLGHDGEQAPYLESLAGAAQICVEHDEGDLSKAFKVAGYPAFCLLGADGTVLASGYDPQMLPEPALA